MIRLWDGMWAALERKGAQHDLRGQIWNTVVSKGSQVQGVCGGGCISRRKCKCTCDHSHAPETTGDCLPSWREAGPGYPLCHSCSLGMSFVCREQKLQKTNTSNLLTLRSTLHSIWKFWSGRWHWIFSFFIWLGFCPLDRCKLTEFCFRRSALPPCYTTGKGLIRTDHQLCLGAGCSVSLIVI